MSLTEEQKKQIDKLIEHRDAIVDSLANIQHILKQYFPEEFDLAYQHYIPQITTALYEDKKWLSRGGYSMQDTINHLTDKSNNNKFSGVSKYI